MICRNTVLSALAAAASLIATETPSEALLVLNKDANELAIVDPVSQKVLARVPTGEGPHELAVSTDGKLAFAGNYGARTPGNTISVIDLVAQKELRRVDLGPLRRPHGMTFHGGKVYFTAEVNRLIGRYDPPSNQIDWLFGTGQSGTHMVILSKDGNHIFTSNIGSDSVSVIERPSEAAAWAESAIAVGKGPEAIDMSPDGKEVWSGHSGDGGVSIIDTATKKVIQTLNLGAKHINRLKFTLDGKLVLISDPGTGNLVALDAAGRKEIKRMKLGSSVEGILIAPDGAHAYVAVSGDNNVAVVDLKSLEVTSRISTGPDPDGMAWASRK
jgi:YVTN family beta-propeller protein